MFIVGALILSGASSVRSSSQASATAATQAGQDNAVDPGDQVRVLTITGLLDAVVNDFILTELDRAEADGVLAVLLAIDSDGSVLDKADYLNLAQRLKDSPVQIVMWVGPSGSSALGGTAELLGTADLVGVSVGSRVGDTGAARLPMSFGPAFGEATNRLVDEWVGAPDAVELGISVGPLERASVLRDFVNEIDGYQSPADSDQIAELSQIQFLQLSLTGQLFHSVASPEVAYLFFVGGLALLVFELFTAGVGIAGMIGAGLLALGAYGLDVLPTRWWAIGLLMAALLAMAVDIQTNIPRLYSIVGMVLFVLGSWFLYDGVSMSWVTFGAGVIGAMLYVYTGMPSMVRTRFSTPTIGRKWMIGKMGEAATSLSPEGVVRINDTPWQAVTNRATPIGAGQAVRVIGINRMLLEVEPEQGAAKDYRDRS